MILDKFRLDGLVAIVTGGTQGLGKAMAKAFAEAGADVALVSRKSNQEFLDELKALGRRCMHYPADLTDRSVTRRVVPEIVAEMGRVDILVNNAGYISRTEVAEFPESEWDKTIELNLSATFLLSQAAGKLMLERGRGKIINTASILSFQGGLYVPAYVSTKHAIVGLTRSLSNAWAPHGINVNAIAPGFYETDLTSAVKNDPQRAAGIVARTPAGRWGNPEELAGAALFLASPASDFVHGVVLPVDGGWLAW